MYYNKIDKLMTIKTLLCNTCRTNDDLVTMHLFYYEKGKLYNALQVVPAFERPLLGEGYYTFASDDNPRGSNPTAMPMGYTSLLHAYL